MFFVCWVFSFFLFFFFCTHAKMEVHENWKLQIDEWASFSFALWDSRLLFGYPCVMWGELRHGPGGAVRRKCRAAARGDSLSPQDRQGPSGKGNGKAAVLAARRLDLWKSIPPATLLILFFASHDAEFSFLKCPAPKTKTYSTHVSALSHLLEQKPAFRMETVIFTLLLGFGSF